MKKELEHKITCLIQYRILQRAEQFRSWMAQLRGSLEVYHRRRCGEAVSHEILRMLLLSNLGSYFSFPRPLA